MTRVLVVTHVFPRAVDDPSAPFLLRWAQALAAAGVDVGVVAPHDAGLPDRHVVGGIPVRLARYAPEAAERLAYRGEMHQLARTPVGPPLVAGLLVGMARTVRAQVAAGRPDVVHVHWWVPGAVVTGLARVDVPTVLTVHGTDVALLEHRPRMAALARWALARVDRVEAVSADLADRLEAATGRRADAVNPMPADLQPAPGAVAEGADGRAVPTVLAAGRMVPEKGFADLIAAAALLDMPVRLVIAGDGPERAALAEQALLLGVDLALPGALAPAALCRAYAQADVVVQASHREGLGLVAAEAVAAGTPVVATDSGGVRDVLDTDELVPVGDVRALAAAVKAVLADPVTARGRAAEAGQRVRAYLSPAAAAARTLDGYALLH
jgi:glycosyltransferase involved in cell wall biosynthesis